MEIEREKRELADRYGPWTAHNIRLADGVWTIGPTHTYDHLKLTRIVQVVSDLSRTPIERQRILDLGCLEGLYCAEFGRRGATVLGIEGREGNWAKAEFARRALGLERVAIRHADVRSVLTDPPGRFDTVLCLGLLYHLDHPEVFQLLSAVARLTDLLILDTHVSARARVRVEYGGKKYGGRYCQEYSPTLAAAEVEAKRWASLGNPRSFWPTRESLLTALADVGFSSVFEVLVPAEPAKPADRLTLAAVRGTAQETQCDAGAELPTDGFASPPISTWRTRGRRLLTRIWNRGDR